MRIAINCRKITGAYGGVNQFSQNLEDYLSGKGHQVFRNLAPDIDIILIVSSKTNVTTTSFSPSDAEDYLLLRPETVIVQRINTCNEQRASDLGLNQTLLSVNRIADHTVFVSEFIRELYTRQGFDATKPNSVILTGVDNSVFNPEGRALWKQGTKMKVVTHHWSSNYMKGFDTYERLDLLLNKNPYRNLFNFTIIGNMPPGFELHNTKVMSPLKGAALAGKLKENHLYLTGARHEPGGNHYIEAMRCGLPVLYLESGASGEYCSQYGGIGFTPVDFEDKLRQAILNYEANRAAVLRCPFSAAWMGSQYEALFLALIRDITHRGYKKSPFRYHMKWARKKSITAIRALVSRFMR